MVRIELPAEYTYLQARLMRRQAWVDNALLSLAEGACDAPLPHPPGAPPIMVTQMPLDEDSPYRHVGTLSYRVGLSRRISPLESRSSRRP